MEETKWDDVPLSDMVELYNSATPGMPSYHTIENRILSLGYVYPQTYLDLEEEDASAFILFLHSSIPQIISNFDYLKGSFEDYLMGVLKIQVKAFNRHKAIDYRRQLVVEEAAGKQSMMVSEPTFNGKSIKARRLKYILRRSNTCRRRIFVFILSLAPFMPLDTLEELCTKTNMDFLEMLDFREQLVKLCSDDLDNLSRLKELRTTYFSNFLLESANSNPSAKKKLHFLDNKNSEIASISKRATNQSISKVLGLSAGTVGNYLYLARVLLEWVADPSNPKFSAESLSIRWDMYEFIRSCGKTPEPFDGKLSSVYHPLEDFTVVKVEDPLIESPS